MPYEILAGFVLIGLMGLILYAGVFLPGRIEKGEARGVSARLRDYLAKREIPYELVHHLRTFRNIDAAAAAHVPPDQVAKSVIVEDDGGYLQVVIPATHRLRMAALGERFGHDFELATEPEVRKLFKDCEVGAIPALGQAYGLRTLVDDALLELDDVYFESGEHTELLHLSGENFRALMADAEHGHFAEAA